METKTIKLKLKSSNIPSNQTSEIKKNFQILYDYAEIWDNYDESNIKIVPPTNQDMVANEELPFRCDLVNVPPEIQELKEDGHLDYLYDWSFTHTNLISDVNAKNPMMVFPHGGENILVKVVVTCEADIGNFEFSKKTASKFIDIKDDIPSLWNKWVVDSSNSSDGVIRLTENGNRIDGVVKSSVTYKLIFDIIRIPDEIPKSSLTYYWEADESAVLSSNRDKTPSIVWDKVDKKETKPVNLRVEYDDPNSNKYLPFKTLVRHFEVYPNFLVDWWANWSPSIISPSEIIANTKQPYDVNLNNLAGIEPSSLVYEWSSPDDMVLNNISLKSPTILWKTHGQKTLNVEITHIEENVTPKFLSKVLDVQINILDIWNAWNPAIQFTPPVIKDKAVPFTANPSAPTELDSSQLGYQWSSPDGDISRLYNKNTDVTFTTSGNGKVVKLNISYPGLPDKDLERIVSVGPSPQDEWNNIAPGDFSLSGPTSVFVNSYSNYTVTNIASALSGTSLNQSELLFEFTSPNSNVANGKKTSSESDDVEWYSVGITSLIVEISYNGLNGVKSIEKQIDVSKNPENVWGNMLNGDVYINYESDEPFELDVGTTKEFVAHVNLPTILNFSDLRYEWDFGNSNNWSSPSSSNSKSKEFLAEENTNVAVRVSHVNYPGTLKNNKDIVVGYSDAQLVNLWDNWNPTMTATPPGPITMGESVDFVVDISNYPSELDQSKLVYNWSTSDDYVITSQNQNNATMRFENVNPDLVVCTITTTEDGLTDKSKELSKQISVSPASFDMTINDPGNIETTDITFTITGTLNHVNNDSSTSAINNKTITANIIQSTPSLSSSTTTTDSSGNFSFDVSINGFSGDMDFEFFIEESNDPHPYTVPVTGVDNQQIWDNWNPIMIANPPGDISLGTIVNYEVDLSNFPSQLDVNDLTYSWVDPTILTDFTTTSGTGGININFDYNKINENENISIYKFNSPPGDVTVRCFVNISDLTGSKNVSKVTTINNMTFDMTINDPGIIRTEDLTFTITGTLNHVNNDSSTNVIGNKTIISAILQSTPGLNSNTVTTDNSGNFSFDVNINGFSGDIDFEFFIEESSTPHPYTVPVITGITYEMSYPDYVEVPRFCPSTISGKLDSYDGSSSDVGNKVLNIDHAGITGNSFTEGFYGEVTTDPNGNFTIDLDTYENGTSNEYLNNYDNYIVNKDLRFYPPEVLKIRPKEANVNDVKTISINVTDSVTFNMSTSSSDPYTLDDTVVVTGVLHSISHECDNIDTSISNRSILGEVTKNPISLYGIQDVIVTTDGSGNFTAEFDPNGDGFISRTGTHEIKFQPLFYADDNAKMTHQFHKHNVVIYYSPNFSAEKHFSECEYYLDLNDFPNTKRLLTINDYKYELDDVAKSEDFVVTHLNPSENNITLGDFTVHENTAMEYEYYLDIGLNKNGQTSTNTTVKFSVHNVNFPSQVYDFELYLIDSAQLESYNYKNIVSIDNSPFEEYENRSLSMEISHDKTTIFVKDKYLDIGTDLSQNFDFTSFPSWSQGQKDLQYETYLIQLDTGNDDVKFYDKNNLNTIAHVLSLPSGVSSTFSHAGQTISSTFAVDYSGTMLLVGDYILKIDYDNNSNPIAINHFSVMPCVPRNAAISNNISGDSNLRRVVLSETSGHYDLTHPQGVVDVYDFSINDPGSITYKHRIREEQDLNTHEYVRGTDCAISLDGGLIVLAGLNSFWGSDGVSENFNFKNPIGIIDLS